MDSTDNKGKSGVADRFIKTLKGKIYKKMTGNNRRSYLGYWDKLIDEYNDTYHNSIHKKPVDAGYSVLAEKIESSHQAPKFKAGDKIRITKYKNILAKVTLAIGQMK